MKKSNLYRVLMWHGPKQRHHVTYTYVCAGVGSIVCGHVRADNMLIRHDNT